jgi:iron complex outermembrane recepter protein
VQTSKALNLRMVAKPVISAAALMWSTTSAAAQDSPVLIPADQQVAAEANAAAQGNDAPAATRTDTTIPAGETPQDGGPDIVVTGSLLRNVRQEDRASPILAVNQEDLAKTGITSLADITRFIPQNVGSAGGIQDLAKGGGADSRDTRSPTCAGSALEQRWCC